MESIVAIASLVTSAILFLAYAFKARQARSLATELTKKANELAMTILSHKLDELSEHAKQAKEKHEQASSQYRDYVNTDSSDDSGPRG